MGKLVYSILLLIIVKVYFAKCSNEQRLKLLRTDSDISVPKKHRSDLDMYLYNPVALHIYRIWTTARIEVNDSSNECKIYRHANESELINNWKHEHGWFATPWSTSRRQYVGIDPFQKQYIGVATSLPYTIRLHLVTVDLKLVLIFAAGLVLYFFASTLAKHVAFYYASGVGVGLIASILIVLYVFSRMVPRRTWSLSFLFGGWSLWLYALYTVLPGFPDLVRKHPQWTASYLVTVSLISLAVMYRFGPPSHPRSLQLVQWALQTIALAMVLFSSWARDATLAIVFTLIISKWLPEIKIPAKWLPTRPRKLLTEEEYMNEGQQYTQKSLNELRQYCVSPECKQWSLTARLSDPRRFASFVEGDSHLTDDELLAHSQPELLNLTDESDSDDDDGDDCFHGNQRNNRSTQYTSVKNGPVPNFCRSF